MEGGAFEATWHAGLPSPEAGGQSTLPAGREAPALARALHLVPLVTDRVSSLPQKVTR